MAKVDIVADPPPGVADEQEAADELNLEPGVRAVASIKATNVVVELAPH